MPAPQAPHLRSPDSKWRARLSFGGETSLRAFTTTSARTKRAMLDLAPTTTGRLNVRMHSGSWRSTTRNRARCGGSVARSNIRNGELSEIGGASGQTQKLRRARPVTGPQVRMSRLKTGVNWPTYLARSNRLEDYGRVAF